MNDMWYLLGDHERYVYHYTRAEVLAEKILPGRSIQFSKFRDVKDPKESKDFRFSFSSVTPSFYNRWDGVNAEINSLMKDFPRLACFVCDPPDAVMAGRDEPGIDTLRHAHYRGHSRPNMWDRYADGNRGACLIFDKAKLDASIRASAAQFGAHVYDSEVEYRDFSVGSNLRSPHVFTFCYADVDRHGIQSAAAAHISRHWHELFFVKGTSWTQEWEYRWLVALTDATVDFLVNIEHSLIGILFGSDMGEDIQSQIVRKVWAESIQLASMDWHNGLPSPEGRIRASFSPNKSSGIR